MSLGHEYFEVEQPFIESLKKRGYEFVSPEKIEEERESPRQVILEERFKRKLKEFNPWISDYNLRKVVREFTTPGLPDLMEANKKLYRMMTECTSVEQDLGNGRKNQTVEVIDFENPENNEFIVTNQFKVWGPKKNIKPDVVVFVNGLPLVVVECKSPTTPNAKDKGIKQLKKYQSKKQGAPQLFYTNQILIETCMERASASTTLSSPTWFKPWKESYPTTPKELEEELGRKPRRQEILIEGMLTKQNLLDIVRNFIIFEKREKTIKEMALYHQFRAANKICERVLNKERSQEKGGVIWHTQGAGKSLTMRWAAGKLRRIKELENPTLLVLTDRIALDNQIGGLFTRTDFKNCRQTESGRDLESFIKNKRGMAIVSTINKFHSIRNRHHGKMPVLSDDENIIVMTDEAHRTQYKEMALEMRTALPNATYIAFTGTPIDKKDRSTPRLFGSYVDKYTITQSVKDGATLPILFEGRMPKLHVEGKDIDEIFEMIFGDYPEEEKVKLRKKFNLSSIIRCRLRLEKITVDMIKHFTNYIEPNGFKAQVVAADRWAALRYYNLLKELNSPPAALVITVENNDGEEFDPARRSKDEEKKIISRFKDPNDPLKIVVVCAKLITGFDAPIEQVMYLDKGLKEHNLLQAIARVNRTYPKKEAGLVIDYYGVTDDLDDALRNFKKEDVMHALTEFEEEFEALKRAHRRAMQMFDDIKYDIEKCIERVEPEDVRSEFDRNLRSFSAIMDLVLPDPRAEPFLRDLKFLARVRERAKKRYREEETSLEGCGEKVQRIVDEHLRCEDVEVLEEPVSILQREAFQEELSKLPNDKARASEIKHALQHEISIRINKDPAFYGSLKKRLEELVSALEAKRLGLDDFIEKTQPIREEMSEREKRAQELGLESEEFSFYNLLEKHEVSSRQERRDLAKELYNILEESAVIDWKQKDNIQRIMRRDIKRKLISEGLPADTVSPLTLKILDLARNVIGEKKDAAG